MFSNPWYFTEVFKPIVFYEGFYPWYLKDALTPWYFMEVLKPMVFDRGFERLLV